MRSHLPSPVAGLRAVILLITLILFGLGSNVRADGHGSAPEVFLEGEIQVVHIENEDPSLTRTAYFLVTDPGDNRGRRAQALELRFERTAPASLETGQRVNIRGRAVGRELWVDDIAATGGDGGDGAETTGQTTTAAAVANPHSSVVLLVNITGTTHWTSSHIGTAEGVMYSNANSVDATYSEASFDQLGFPAENGLVVAPITVDKIAGCPIYSYASAADSAALSQQGVDVNNYQHRIYIIPSDGAADSDCSWLAVGVIGGYGSTGTLRAWSTVIDSNALAHELGHNVGWHHAATDPANNGYSASEGDLEYGDTSGTMGYCCTEKKFNAVHMDQIGWYDNLAVGTMITATSSGSFTLAPLGSDPDLTADPQIIKVDKPDSNEVYYLSYRQRTGLDVNLGAGYITGLSIHHGQESGRWSYLVDVLSDSDNLFQDAVNGLTIEQNWHNPGGVNITLSYESCLAGSPTVSLVPASQTVDPASVATVSYQATITSNDGAGCEASSYSLSSTLGTLSPSSVLLGPGQMSATANLDLSVPASDGTYLFTVSAQGAGGSGSDQGDLMVDGQPPSAPGNPNAASKKVKGQKSVEVSWSAASDTGTGVKEYRVTRDGGAWSATTADLKIIDPTAATESDHLYTITAVDEVGHESTAASATYVAGSGGNGGGRGNGKGGGKPN